MSETAQKCCFKLQFPSKNMVSLYIDESGLTWLTNTWIAFHSTSASWFRSSSSQRLVTLYSKSSTEQEQKSWSFCKPWSMKLCLAAYLSNCPNPLSCEASTYDSTDHPRSRASRPPKKNWEARCLCSFSFTYIVRNFLRHLGGNLHVRL